MALLHKRHKLVGGWGVNNADYQVAETLSSGKVKTCPLYGAWKSMVSRCYAPNVKKKHATYAGCTVAPEWKKFMSFRAWAILTQNWEGNELDKDLLFPGNKVYSENTCIFVPQHVNIFVRPARNKGVVFVGGRPRAVIKNPLTGKTDYLGTFATQVEAEKAWTEKKYEFACQLADTLEDQVVASALRLRYKEN